MASTVHIKIEEFNNKGEMIGQEVQYVHILNDIVKFNIADIKKRSPETVRITVDMAI